MTKISNPHSAGVSPDQPGRRQFFRTSAKAAGALSAMALLPASIQRALAIPAAVETGTIKDIKHVVILMQENRSFDHYFGTMRGVRGFGDRFPIPLTNGKSVFFQPNPAGGQEIQPFHRDSRTGNALIGSGTPHNFPDQQAAWNQGKMDRWIQFKNQATMGFFMREDIPFQFALADAFTICDGYHCSILTGTDPNRIVFWSGANANPALLKQGINSTDTDSEPVNSRCWPNPFNWVAGRAQQADGSGQIDPETGAYNYKYTNSAFKWDTLPDLLERAGVSWHIYQNMNNNWTGAMHGCLAFQSFRSAQPGSSIYEHGLTGGPEKDDGAANFLAQLRQDVLNGTLPEVSWVLPTQDLAEHPGSKEGVAGAADFVAEVLDALTSNPDVWSKTAVFVTFDENDGFFDHLPMPAVPSYDASGTLMGKSTVPLEGEYFDASVGNYLSADDATSGKIRPWGLSSRVPMYVLSPWSKGGWVNSEVFDHTSVGRFLEKRFDITVDAISPWHRAVCGDLTTCFDFVSPNDPVAPKLPDTSNYPAINAAQRLLPTTTVTQAPAVPQPLYQETGTRLSRALPYELHTSARVGQDGAVELLFSNTGKVGAVFHVYDQRNLDLIPRRYTLEAGKSLSDTWSGGDYDLWVYSTNGFVRTFSGNTRQGAALEVQVCYEPAGSALYVKVSNHGTTAMQASLRANAYRTDGPWTLAIEPGAVAEHHWSIADSGNWYDFSVAAEGFERRFAGRMETGSHSVSDPAMAQHL
ncbi:phospholipase C, phosphocholine-specific [Bordetella tumbae]|uniref:phosphocholine-specific phospholipase C n=1 Tax=Bordetella tumbae TaxID=1649139 RepID=UPI0039EDEC67